jgi:hypothetical protein
VAEAVHAAQVDEQTVVGDVGDGAANDLALLEGSAHLLAQGGALILEDRAAGDDHVVPFAVELENLELKGLADQAVQILDRAQIDLRIGEKRRYTDINRHAAP